MNTREIAAEYRLGHWAEIMRERRESGLNIKAYCERSGFHENVYYYWQRKLREAASNQHTEVQGKASHTGLTVAGFAEVRIADTAAPGSAAAGQLKVEIGGLRLTVDSAYPLDKLMQLLRELMKSC